MAITAACVNISVLNTGTLQDAFQFDPDGGTSWSLTGKTFQMDIKASREDITPLLTLTSGAGEIVVDDEVTRVVHLNVDPAALQAALPCGQYVYDFVMVDPVPNPDVITPLMQGTFCLSQGVTEV